MSSLDATQLGKNSFSGRNALEAYQQAILETLEASIKAHRRIYDTCKIEKLQLNAHRRTIPGTWSSKLALHCMVSVSFGNSDTPFAFEIKKAIDGCERLEEQGNEYLDQVASATTEIVGDSLEEIERRQHRAAEEGIAAQRQKARLRQEVMPDFGAWG